VELNEDVWATLVADREAPQAAEPGELALEYPSMAAKPLAAVDAAPGDPGVMFHRCRTRRP
jgi:hypothetical protein